MTQKRQTNPSGWEAFTTKIQECRIHVPKNQFAARRRLLRCGVLGVWYLVGSCLSGQSADSELGRVSSAQQPVELPLPDGIHIKGQWSINYARKRESFADMRFDGYVASNRYFFAVDHDLPWNPVYIIATSDGIDSLATWNPITWKRPDQLPPVATGTQKTAVGTVHTGVFPTGQELVVQTLWLAFAYQFQTNISILRGDHVPLKSLVEHRFLALEDFIVEAEHAGSMAIKRMRFYQPGRGTVKGMTNEFRQEQEAYTDGYLFAEYQALESTNFNRVEVPTTFVFRKYIEKQGGSPVSRDDVTLHLELHCKVSQVAFVEDLPDDLPFDATNGITVVNDYRITRWDGRPYFGFRLHHNGEFMRRDSPAFKAVLASMDDMRRRQNRSRLLFPIMFLLMVMPLAFFMARRRKQSSVSTE